MEGSGEEDKKLGKTEEMVLFLLCCIIINSKFQLIGSERCTTCGVEWVEIVNGKGYRREHWSVPIGTVKIASRRVVYTDSFLTSNGHKAVVNG
ncbi:hypothetical protein L1987_33595 [Smallanthus sonchifolius]|uniref:Uncharacterized protein n=1 Tax=Smallanthus sonchifolius TaxID=185202 RepID=A0ACB9HQZ2_9ASTR|nr:hypothetical protein L1987_33595 [Smallanthus sonchifolius]